MKQLTLSLLGLILLLQTACQHVNHTANVRPRVEYDFAVAGVKEVYDTECCPESENKSGKVADVQISVSKGKIYRNGQALLVRFVATRHLFSSGFDIYWQFARSPLNLGAGVVLGFDPALYVMTGKEWPIAGHPNQALSLDAGIAALGWSDADNLSEAPLRPHLQITWLKEKDSIGLWASYVRYSPPLGRCFDCESDRPEDYLAKRWLIGLTFGVTGGKRSDSIQK